MKVEGYCIAVPRLRNLLRRRGHRVPYTSHDPAGTITLVVRDARAVLTGF